MKRHAFLKPLTLAMALVFCLSAFVSTLPVLASAPTNDTEAQAQSYACKIVKADNSVVYYQYFSPMDAVGSTSAFATVGSTQSAIDAVCATANLAEGDTVVLLKDITLVPVASGYGNRKNVQAASGYIRTNSISFTIDGNQHSYSAPAGFIAYQGNLTVKNLIYTMTGSEGIGHARNGHTLTFEDCSLTIAGVRPESKGDGYFAFNTGVGTIDLKNTTVSLAKGIVPELPLFHSKYASSNLKLHNVTADYSKVYTGSENEGWTEGATTVPLLVATQAGMSITMSGNTALTSATKGFLLASGGSVEMKDTASLKIDCPSNGSYKNYQAIYAYGADQSFSLRMSDSSQILSGVVGVSVETLDSNPPCASAQIVLNDYAMIDAHRSLRIHLTPTVVYLNDSASVYHTAAQSFDGVKTQNAIWVDSNNKSCPIYVNCDASFSASSSSARIPYTYGSALTDSMDLRFDSRIQADTTALEFGTLILPTDSLWDVAEFTHKDLADAKASDASFQFVDIKSTEANRLSCKIKEDGNLFYLFSAILSGVSNNNTSYSARAYAKYAKGSTAADSASGIWIYSYYDVVGGGRSKAYTAYEAIHDTKGSPEEYSAEIDNNGDGFYRFNVAETGETPAYSRYTKEHYNAMKPLAAQYLTWSASQKSAQNQSAFASTTEANGVKVHTIEIGDKKTATQTTTIVQVTDLHFNVHYDPEVEGKSWPHPTTANGNAQKVIDYVNGVSPDQLLITGDLYNAYSADNMRLFESYVWNNIDPGKTMVSLGNHDLVDTTDGAEVYSKNWAKDYESKVLNGSVMIIQLNNATTNQCAFTADQVARLEKDLADARANQYDVLLFYHIPLLTSNEADAVVNRLDNLGDNNNETVNLYQNNQNNYSNWKTDYTTQKAYDLILNHADIIDAAFCGHKHVNLYSEIKGIGGNIIPQYTLIGNAYGSGNALKILVYN